MNKGIEILLARMESNPDEFITGNRSGKWLHLIEAFEDDMIPEEKTALMTKYHALRMDKFTERVMKELFEEKEEPVAHPFGQAAINSAAGQTHTPSSITNHARMMQAQLAYNNALASAVSATAAVQQSNLVNNAYAATSTTSTPVWQREDPTLDKGFVKKLKKALGL